MTVELALGPLDPRRLTALLVVAAIARIAQQQRVAGHQTHRALLALEALPLDVLGAEILDERGRVLETVRMARCATVAAREKAIDQTGRRGRRLLAQTKAAYVADAGRFFVALRTLLDHLDDEYLFGREWRTEA